MTSRSRSSSRRVARPPCSRSTSHFRWRCGAISCRRRRWCSPSRHSFARSSHAISSPSSALARRPGTQDRRRPGSHHRLRYAPISSTPGLSRHLMRNERGERQIVVVTDGEPTAIYSPTVSPSSLGRRCAKPWKRPWPRSCAARRPVSRSTPSPSTSSEASFRSWNRSPRSTGTALLHRRGRPRSYALDDFVKHRRAD